MDGEIVTISLPHATPAIRYVGAHLSARGVPHDDTCLSRLSWNKVLHVTVIAGQNIASRVGDYLATNSKPTRLRESNVLLQIDSHRSNRDKAKDCKAPLSV